MNTIPRITLLILLIGNIALLSNGQSVSQRNPSVPLPSRPLVTLIELGSVRCIPCKAMQPVMASLEKKYGGQLHILFYDVWKPEQAHFGKQYSLRLIPTQVFLDSNGKEFFRHEGFFPEAHIDTLLHAHGLKIRRKE